MVNIKKMFVYSNSYTARVLLRCCEFIFPPYGCEIILLSELGVSDDLQANGINIAVHTYDTLRQCIESCTEVLIVLSDAMPKIKIDRVIALTSLQGKHCTVVEGFQSAWVTDIEGVNLKQMPKNVPTILLVSLNAQMQLSCWEVGVNKLLVDNGFRVYQEMSVELGCVINWLLRCNIIEKNLLCKKFFTADNCEVAVKSVQYKFSAPFEMSRLISELHPDIIIAIVGSNYYDYGELVNIFKYRHGCKVDVFAKSEFLEFILENEQKKVVLDTTLRHENRELLINLNDPLLISRLSEAIVPKFSLPDGVMII